MSNLTSNNIVATKIATECDIFNLPEEVLVTIFSFLTVSDRKNVKLVCKTWVETCNVRSLLKDEAFTCLGVNRLSDIYQLLDRCERRFLNLKFQNVKFLANSFSFWKNNGSKIQSIYFIDCEFENNILREIIIFCENLLNLSFKYTSQCDRNGLPPIVGLEGFLRDGVVRENLDSLKIDFLDSLWISNYTLHQLFSIFPSVKILEISFTVVGKNFEKILLDPTEFAISNDFTFSPILNYLITSAHRIEKLKLHFPNNEFSASFLHRIFETLTAMPKLTDLSLNMRGVPQSESMETFVHLNNLKSLEFYMKIDPRPTCDLKYDSSLENVLLQLLHSNSDLKFLKISFFETLVITDAFFQELMTSSLKSLEIADFILIPPENVESCRSYFSKRNTVLRNLALSDLMQIPPSSYVVAFPNLHHLKITKVDYYGLKQIFTCLENMQMANSELLALNYHLQQVLDANAYTLTFFTKENRTKLRSLILHDDRIVADNWEMSESMGFYNRRLQNIEYLDLPCLAGYIFLKSLSQEPILANLKYLRIEITKHSKLLPSDLLESVDVMPFLEGLYVYYDVNAKVDFWTKLCIKLSRLRYLFFKAKEEYKAKNIDDIDYRKLFSVCPSLRAVIHDSKSNSDVGFASYFFDIIKKQVVLKRENYLYSLYLPKIGEFSVDWLNF